MCFGIGPTPSGSSSTKKVSRMPRCWSRKSPSGTPALRCQTSSLSSATTTRGDTRCAIQIRANQGHSIEGIAAFETTPKTPPDTLYHRTSTQNWKRIREAGGLKRMNRHHVHLSPDEETAERVGARRKGEVILLPVNAKRMAEDGYEFFLSDNDVWLVNEVPIVYLREL
jgi:RNA:NAD 2'-phosphotransferase (TPT1/KptA family)